MTAESSKNAIPATLIPGDGIGPEIVEATLAILDALGAPFDWETHQAGMAGVDACGDPLPPATLDSIRRTGLALKGPLTTPVGGGFRSSNVRLREEFQLFAQRPPGADADPGRPLRRHRSRAGARKPRRPVRRASSTTSRSATTRTRWRSAPASTRAQARDASRSSRSTMPLKNGRKKVTIVHKANIMKALTGVFLETAQRSRKALRGPSRDRRPDRGRVRDAARAQPVAVRRHPLHQPLRRHPLRPDRRAGRRAGHGAGREHRRQTRRSSRRCTARRRTSPAKASPTRWRCCWPRR